MRRVDGWGYRWGHTPFSVRLAFSAQIEHYLGPSMSISSPAAMRGKAIIATDATVDNRSSAVRGEEGAEETRGGAEREGEGSEGAGGAAGVRHMSGAGTGGASLSFTRLSGLGGGLGAGLGGVATNAVGMFVATEQGVGAVVRCR